MSLETVLRETLAEAGRPAGETGADRKNYTERVSHLLARAVARRLRDLGLRDVVAAEGRDRQFMGGYGTKGVDVYLADDKHGLLLSSGVKGILFDVRKNLKNRYRDVAFESLELHTRFPFAVCGHLLFLGQSECSRRSQRFGTVLGEAVALLSAIAGRARPTDPPALYECLGVVLLEPGEPETADLTPPGVPAELHAVTYCERLVDSLLRRNPFLEAG